MVVLGNTIFKPKKISLVPFNTELILDQNWG